MDIQPPTTIPDSDRSGPRTGFSRLLRPLAALAGVAGILATAGALGASMPGLSAPSLSGPARPSEPALLAAAAKTGKGASDASGASAKPAAKPAPTSAKNGGWVSVDYSSLLDRRRLTHSGESVGELLERLAGRSLPPPGERIPDRMAHMLLEPLLEPYAFVLPDALDSLQAAPDPPMVEIGSLWQPGEAQPGWAELLRSRRFVVESDGAGRLRLFLPLPAASAGAVTAALSGSGATGNLPDSTAAAEAAYRDAWPVLRHAFAAERRRLAQRAGSAAASAPDAAGAAQPPLQVEVRGYVHVPEKSVFQLGTGAFTTTVTDTAASTGRGPADLAAWQSFLERGQQLEGGRLTSDGRLKLLGSDADVKPSLLGQPITLADLAVAHRAIFHGGLAEPYMSLDPWYSPQTAQVNYGGRLQDTSLGLVSLLSDVRFKTFSLGMDIVLARDERERIRRSLPGFFTHMERFAADAGSRDILGQQTRFWFYPDTVELALSEQGDMLAIRRARLSAASERLGQELMTAPGASAAAASDPQWTVKTIASINAGYDTLSGLFPELADLDQVARLLSLFTWLRQAAADGLPVPDLDTLLALELPARPTPRMFPMLLTHNTLRHGAAATSVDVVDRAPVGVGLDQLFPMNGNPLPAPTRLSRALAALDPQKADAAAVL